MPSASRGSEPNYSPTISEVKEKVTDQFEKMADKATDQFRQVADQVEGVASQVTRQSRDVGDQVQQVAGNIKSAVNKSVKEQPMATLALAAALGFVLGALWKS
jgi:ElaB/YqjD/DUF883 family membrane-anchored ribosome-binding protein